MQRQSLWPAYVGAGVLAVLFLIMLCAWPRRTVCPFFNPESATAGSAVQVSRASEATRTVTYEFYAGDSYGDVLAQPPYEVRRDGVINTPDRPFNAPLYITAGSVHGFNVCGVATAYLDDQEWATASGLFLYAPMAPTQTRLWIVDTTGAAIAIPVIVGVQATRSTGTYTGVIGVVSQTATKKYV